MFAIFFNVTICIMRSKLNNFPSYLKIQKNKKEIWMINEEEGLAKSSKKKLINIKFELMSQMINLFLQNIKIKKKRNLVTLNASIKQHHLFLDSIIRHWNKSNKSNQLKVSFT